MAKILVIEDNNAQLSWAKKELKGHDVTFATNTHEGGNTLMNAKFMIGSNFDLVIVDMGLPRTEGGKPEFKNGLELFEDALVAMQNGKLQGAAIVSNYEHHVHHDVDSEQLDRAYQKLNFIRKVSIQLFRSEETNEIEYKKDVNMANVVIFFDSNLSVYPAFKKKDGKIVNSRYLGHQEKYALVKDGGAINLKPFKEIVNALLGT